MANYFLLALSTCATSGKAIFCKLVGLSNKNNSFFLSNFKSFFFAFILSLIFSADKLGQLFTISSFSILLSLFFALFIFMTQVFQILAMKVGSATLTTLIYSCGFLLPIFYSAIAFSETISLLQIIGVLILIVALVLIVFEKKQGSTSFKWFLLALLSMIGSGMIAITQKTHQKSDFNFELQIFLVYAFLFSALFSLFGHLITNKFKLKTTDTTDTNEKFSFKSWLKNNYGALLLGLIVFSLNFLNLLLSGKIPAVIQFPVSNVGSLILTNLLSTLILKEKIRTQQKIGCAVGVLAILLVGLC